jgi:hypothetical protein
MSTSTEKTKHTPHIGNLVVATFRILFVVLLITAGSFVARAQDPAPAASPTPDPEIERLEREAKKAELEKKIRDARPQPSSTAPEGKTEADDKVEIESQMVTYKAMSDVAERIGIQIHERFGGAQAIVIYDPEELQNVKHSRAIMPVVNKRMEGQQEKYKDVFTLINADPELKEKEFIWDAKARGFFRPSTDKAGNTSAADSSKKSTASTANAANTSMNSTVNTIAATVNDTSNSATAMANDSSGTAAFSNGVNGFVDVTGGIATGLKAVADLLALMRSDTNIKGHSVTVEERALVAETFRSLRSKYSSISLYYPALVPPEAKFECARGADEEFCSPFLTTLVNLYNKKAWADRSLSQNWFRVTSEFEKVSKRKAGASEEIGALSKQIDDLKL